MAVASVGTAILGLASMAATVNRFRDTTASRSETEALVATVRAGALLNAAVGVVVAVVLVTLALGILRGSNGARIATWVISGAGLLCGCGSLAAVVLQRSVPLTTDARTAAQLDALAAAYPSGWIALTVGLSAAQALSYLVVAALLTLPSANAYFRRRQPWRPPTPPHVAPPPPL